MSLVKLSLEQSTFSSKKFTRMRAARWGTCLFGSTRSLFEEEEGASRAYVYEGKGRGKVR